MQPALFLEVELNGESRSTIASAGKDAAVSRARFPESGSGQTPP
jgi:hypothetical protein